MGHQHLRGIHQRLEIGKSRFPGLREAGDLRRDAINRFSGIGLHGDQKRLLGQHLATRNVKQDRADLKAMLRFGIKASGFRIENQQGPG